MAESFTGKGFQRKCFMTAKIKRLPQPTEKAPV
jgi:hypothetical protein